MAQMRVGSDAYKKEFMSYMIHKSGCDEGAALAEYEAQVEQFGEDEIGDPVFDADECMSYWSE